MRLICYPLEIQHGHNFRVTNQSSVYSKLLWSFEDVFHINSYILQ